MLIVSVTVKVFISPVSEGGNGTSFTDTNLNNARDQGYKATETRLGSCLISMEWKRQVLHILALI